MTSIAFHNLIVIVITCWQAAIRAYLHAPKRFVFRTTDLGHLL
jgi:hypothetical protein